MCPALGRVLLWTLLHLWTSRAQPFTWSAILWPRTLQRLHTSFSLACEDRHSPAPIAFRQAPALCLHLHDPSRSYACMVQSPSSPRRLTAPAFLCHRHRRPPSVPCDVACAPPPRLPAPLSSLHRWHMGHYGYSLAPALRSHAATSIRGSSILPLYHSDYDRFCCYYRLVPTLGPCVAAVGPSVVAALVREGRAFGVGVAAHLRLCLRHGWDFVCWFSALALVAPLHLRLLLAYAYALT